MFVFSLDWQVDKFNPSWFGGRGAWVDVGTRGDAGARGGASVDMGYRGLDLSSEGNGDMSTATSDFWVLHQKSVK
jgi:hypothetical protein